MFGPTAPSDLIDELLTICSDFHPDALAALARSFAETDLRSVLPTIEEQTLVLHGDADTARLSPSDRHSTLPSRARSSWCSRASAV